MSIKDQLKSLTQSDIYTTILFILYKLSGDKQYSTLSQLSFVLDKDQLIKFCEFFGGQTIKIPTKTELSNVISSLMLYTLVDIQGVPFEEALKEVQSGNADCLTQIYKEVKEIVKDYTFIK